MATIVFSTAVEQWGPEARTEIDDLVARMNACGRPNDFRFSRDFVRYEPMPPQIASKVIDDGKDKG